MLAPRTVHRNRKNRPRSAGFTLIELLVAISIIALLIGILFPVMASVLRAAEDRRVRSLLAGLRAAAEEYQIVTDGVIDHTRPRFPSLNSEAIEAADGPGNNTIQLFVYEAGKIPTAAELMAIAAKQELKLNDGTGTAVIADLSDINDPGEIELVDAFGRPIRYAAFVDHDDAFPDDDYLPAHPLPFFASAGPDGLWGVVSDSGVPDDEAADNLYSFDDL